MNVIFMRKKSLALTLMLAFSCLLGGKLMGQTTIEIGSDQSTSSSIPVATKAFYHSLSEQIYTASEITEATGYANGQISKIYFKSQSTLSRKIDIYIRHTTKSSFSNSIEWIPVLSTDLRYSSGGGTVSFVANDWTEITLDTPFEYDGTSNIVVIVDDNTGEKAADYVNFNVYQISSSTYHTNYITQNSNTNIDPCTTTSGANRFNKKNHIKLTFETITYPRPITPTASAITNRTASISWTAPTATSGYTLEGYQYKYTIINTNIWSSTTTTGTTNSCNLESLSGGADYAFVVRAIYTDSSKGTHYSDWAEVDFKTDCDAVDVDDELSWDFENSGSMPDCWTIAASYISQNYGNPTFPQPYNSSTYAHSSNYSIRFCDSNEQVILLPAINQLNGKTLKFYAKASGATGSYTITVGYYNSLGVFTSIKNDFVFSTSYPENAYEVTFNNLPNDVERIAIKGSTDSNSRYLYLDDVSIVAPVSCAPVSSPTVGTVTYNSAQLSWTAGGSETNWKLQYRASGAGSWTTVNVSSANLVAGVYTLTGLSENTTYEWQVAAWCDTSDDDNISSYEAGDDFTTPAEFPAPTGLTVDNITTTSARLSWTTGSVEQDHWDIYYSTNSTAPTVSPDSYISNTTTKPYTITSLTAGKTYYVWVRGNYNNGEHYSVWSEVKSFRVPVSLPYSYDFEDETEMDYWTINGGSSNTGRYNGNGYLSSEYSFRFFYGFNAGTQYLITPELNNTTHGVHVEFYAYRSSSSSSNQSTLNVSYSTEDSNSFDWDDEDAFIPTYNSYTLYKFDFPAGTKYIAIKYVASTYDHIFIDNISFRAPDNTFTTAGNWNTPAYWSYGALPTASDNVTINAACTIPNDCTAQANNITLGSGGSLTIADGGQLICNNSVTAKFQKHIEHYTVAAGKDHYYLIANPTTGAIDPEDVAGMVVDSDVESKDYDLYYFDEAQSGAEWRNYREAPFNLENGKGYLYAKSSDITLEFSGTVLPGTTANITLSKSGSGTYNGFNLVGNPLSNNVTSMKIGESSCSYYKVNSSTGVFAASEADIIVGEAFMVEAPSDEATLTLNPSAKDEAGFTNEIIRLEMSNSKFTDVAYVYFGNHLPLTKINHLNDEAPMLYIHNENSDKAVEVYNNRGEVKSINVNFEAKTIGTYTISAKMVKGEIKYMHLYDRFTGIDTDLLIDDYSFIGANEDQPGRFILKLEAIDNEFEGSDNFAYQSGNNIMVNGEGELQIFDVMGRMVMNERINGVESISGLSRGIYIFRVIGETQKTQKIVVR